jgi:hypothetical protein
MNRMAETCFECGNGIGFISERANILLLVKSNIDIPLGFNDSDSLCGKCAKNCLEERNRLRIQGNCFFCNKILGIHDKKWFKENILDDPDDFTFCDMGCDDCIKKGNILHNQKQKGPTCPLCGTHVIGYGHTCPKCEIKVTYENQKKNGSSVGWYLLSFIFGIIGGLIGYVALRQENPGAASNCLIIGVIMMVLGIIGYFILL